jgi:hypothetical protein
VSAESADRVAFGILCGCASLAARGGSATHTPVRLRFARLRGWGRRSAFVCGWGRRSALSVAGVASRLWSVAGVVVRLCPWLGSPLGFRLWLGLFRLWLVGACQDARVKSSGSLWFGYGVVLVVTFVVGFLAFAVWVLSLVF